MTWTALPINVGGALLASGPRGIRGGPSIFREIQRPSPQGSLPSKASSRKTAGSHQFGLRYVHLRIPVGYMHIAWQAASNGRTVHSSGHRSRSLPARLICPIPVHSTTSKKFKTETVPIRPPSGLSASSGSLAMFTAIRLASSRVSRSWLATTKPPPKSPAPRPRLRHTSTLSGANLNGVHEVNQRKTIGCG
jgi:hypothetical protein